MYKKYRTFFKLFARFPCDSDFHVFKGVAARGETFDRIKVRDITKILPGTLEELVSSQV